jgi:phosphoribosylformylglycinamidine synthase
VEVHYQGKLEVDVPVDPLTEKAPIYQRPMKERSRNFDGSSTKSRLSQLSLDDLWSFAKLGLQETGSPELIFRQYDHHIGTKTVLGPDSGTAAVLWIRDDRAALPPHIGVAISSACNERYTAVDPRLGASWAVLKCARAQWAVGASPLAITDCLNYGNPEDPHVMEDFSKGVDGISEACQAIGVPVVSGNVSLYNETDGQSIYPTPMIGMVGRIENVTLCKSSQAKTQASDLYLLAPHAFNTSAWGGSLLEKMAGIKARDTDVYLPTIDWSLELRAAEILKNLLAEKRLTAVKDIGAGGIVNTALKMILSGPESLGGSFIPSGELARSYSVWPEFKDDFIWFAEFTGAYLLQFADEEAAKKTEAEQKHGKFRLVKCVTLNTSATISWCNFLTTASDIKKQFLNAHPALGM